MMTFLFAQTPQNNPKESTLFKPPAKDSPSKDWGGGASGRRGDVLVPKKLKVVTCESHDGVLPRWSWAPGPLLQHHNSPGRSFPKPGKQALPPPSDHWHRHPPPPPGFLDAGEALSHHENSIQMASRNPWHLEIGGRRASLLTEKQECAICP